MPQPFRPAKYCPRCHTELVKDTWNQTVHLNTARTQCRDQIADEHDELKESDAR